MPVVKRLEPPHKHHLLVFGNFIINVFHISHFKPKTVNFQFLYFIKPPNQKNKRSKRIILMIAMFIIAIAMAIAIAFLYPPICSGGQSIGKYLHGYHRTMLDH
jgi:hypothetical protein